MPYGFVYCARSTALYINESLVTEYMRVGEVNILLALGYKNEDMEEKQVDQTWIEERGWKWPDKLKDVKFISDKGLLTLKKITNFSIHLTL